MHPDIRSGRAPLRAAQGRLDEARGLALAIGLDVVHAESVALTRPRAATLFG
ncbi:MAG: GTPase HflX, partial [Proteobacteria bacterium]|nr:GTPase HflX [Pseudomonadota bacterium]